MFFSVFSMILEVFFYLCMFFNVFSRFALLAHLGKTQFTDAVAQHKLGAKTLLGAPGLTTRSKDATRGSWPYY